MSITDWIIILLFLGGLIAIGFAFSKKNKDLKDYFLAGKSMPTWQPENRTESTPKRLPKAPKSA